MADDKKSAGKPRKKIKRVVAGAVAGALAGVMADAADHRREGVVARQGLPRGVEIARAGLADPFGDIAMHRAGGVAGGGRMHMLRQGRAPGAGLDCGGAAGGPDRRHVPWAIHAAISCNRAATCA